MEWPRVQVTYSKSHTGYKFLGGGWLPILLSYLILTAICLPYLIVLCRGTLNPILPFVSQAAGSPPQSGIFAVFLFLSAMTAFISLNLFYMSLAIKKARLKCKSDRQVAKFLNKALLVAGHIGIAGIIIVASYPIDFHRHNTDWMLVTIVPHLIGALSLFLGGIAFITLTTRLVALLHPEKKRLLCLRMFLITLIVISAAIHGYTVYDGFMVEYYDDNRLNSCVMEKVEYNQAYIMCSVSEWILLFGFVAFFATLKEEAKDFSLDMTISYTIDSLLQGSKDNDSTKNEDENHNVDAEIKKQEATEENS